MKKTLHIALFYLVFNSPSYAQYAWNNVGLGTNSVVQSLAADQANHVLYMGGLFTQAGSAPSVGIAKWDGTNYSALGQGTMSGTGVSSLLYSNGVLYAGGTFTNIDGIVSKNIAQWNGSNWSPLGAGLDTNGGIAVVKALCFYNNDLYAGGFFTRSGSTQLNYIARWDGNNWQSVGGGTNGIVNSLCVYNGRLYAGGTFTDAGGVPVNNIARWDGVNWDDVGGGVSYTGAISVSALQVYSGGLYVGGVFNTAGTTAVRNIAKWDGVNWDDVGGGSNYTGAISVSALEVFNGDLIAGGFFDSLGVTLSRNIGRWNGIDWQPMGSGANSIVYDLETINNVLYAGGAFTMVDHDLALFVAQWMPASSQFISGIQLHPGEQIGLFPNPTNDKVRILTEASFDAATISHFSLVDALGRTILEKADPKVEINLGAMQITPGLYFYKIYGADRSVIKEGKIIFEK